MAVTSIERAGSRPTTVGRNRRFVRLWFSEGSDVEQDIITDIASKNASTISYVGQTWVRQTISIEPIGDPTNTKKWFAEVTYGSPETSTPRETGDTVESFDTTGGTERIKIAQNHITDYDVTGGSTPPTFGGAINVTDDGSTMQVDGIDIPSRVYTFAITKWYDYATVTNTFKGKIYNLTGRVNQATFKGLAAGECLFLGAQGTVRGDDADWEITYRFAGNPNKTNITIGDRSDIAKKGWEYLWVRFGKYIDDEGSGASGLLVMRPTSAHIEQVFEFGNFEDLGL